MCLLFHWGLGLILWILLLGNPIKTGAPERVTTMALLAQAGSQPASTLTMPPLGQSQGKRTKEQAAPMYLEGRDIHIPVASTI